MGAEDPGQVKVHTHMAECVDEEGSCWFDWLADTGDGGDSTYQVARLAARKTLVVSQSNNDQADSLILPRPNLLLIGGDLVYRAFPPASPRAPADVWLGGRRQPLTRARCLRCCQPLPRWTATINGCTRSRWPRLPCWGQQ
jgi:hypothetical protein